MTLYRRLRDISIPLYPMQDQIRTLGQNSKHTSLKTRKIFHGDENWLDEGRIPEKIRLKVTLKAIPRNGEGMPKAVFSKNSKEAQQVDIYEEKFKEFQHTAVEVMYDSSGEYLFEKDQWRNFEGIEFEDMNLLFETKEHLYKKSFVFQKMGLLRVEAEVLEKGEVKITPPGVVGGYPIWGYGGIFKKGCKLEDIEQAVFTITGESEKTVVKISTISQWVERGLVLPETKTVGKLVVVPQDKEFGVSHGLSLKKEIESGSVRCALLLGKDESGEDVIEKYESFEMTGSGEEAVITFKKRN